VTRFTTDKYFMILDGIEKGQNKTQNDFIKGTFEKCFPLKAEFKLKKG